MRKPTSYFVATLFVLCLSLAAAAGQTILKAYAPSESDGASLMLEVDWAQIKTAAPQVTYVLLLKRSAHEVKPRDTVGTLALDSSRISAAGLLANVPYHFFAYFKDSTGTTSKFGSMPAVVHLGPVYSLPADRRPQTASGH